MEELDNIMVCGEQVHILLSDGRVVVLAKNLLHKLRGRAGAFCIHGIMFDTANDIMTFEDSTVISLDSVLCRR